jgi:type IV pilus assembly protein PilW
MMKNLKQNQNGMSLIELLIAMLIGILMLTAAIGMLVSNKRIYKEQNEMGRLQENARFAIELLTNDIRMAGYAGCVDDISLLSNSTTNAGTTTNLHNYTNPIEGINGKTATSTWMPSTSTEARTNITNGTDSFTVRYLDPILSQLNFTSGSTMGSTTAAIPVTCTNSIGTTENCSTSHITPNENLAITDCGTGDIFIATGSTANTITHGATLSKTYDDSAQISRYVTTRYYIGTSANTNHTGDTVPALYRYTSVAGAATTQELIEGVERMEILYGVDTNADSVPDSYLAAGAAGLTTSGNWGNVISVRIAILVRTINENFNINEDTNTYTLLDAAAYDPADEHLRRRVFTTTVQIRNRGA